MTATTFDFRKTTGIDVLGSSLTTDAFIGEYRNSSKSSSTLNRFDEKGVFLDAYDVNDEENSRPIRSVSNRRGRIVRRRISPEFENILYTPNLNSNINRPEIFNLANEVNDIINNQRNRIPTTLSMPEPTLRERTTA